MVLADSNSHATVKMTPPMVWIFYDQVGNSHNAGTHSALNYFWSRTFADLPMLNRQQQHNARWGKCPWSMHGTKSRNILAQTGRKPQGHVAKTPTFCEDSVLWRVGITSELATPASIGPSHKSSACQKLVLQLWLDLNCCHVLPPLAQQVLFHNAYRHNSLVPILLQPCKSLKIRFPSQLRSKQCCGEGLDLGGPVSQVRFPSSDGVRFHPAVGSLGISPLTAAAWRPSLTSPTLEFGEGNLCRSRSNRLYNRKISRRHWFYCFIAYLTRSTKETDHLVFPGYCTQKTIHPQLVMASKNAALSRRRASPMKLDWSCVLSLEAPNQHNESRSSMQILCLQLLRINICIILWFWSSSVFSQACGRLRFHHPFLHWLCHSWNCTCGTPAL